jgi:hypothetical protein
MIAPSMSNPFVAHKMDDTVTLPPGDVPELHAGVLARCAEMLSHAKSSGSGVGLLVVGEAGSGKSHLIAQLRQQLAAVPTAVLVSVSLKGAFAGRLWRPLRERMVTELLRQYPTPTHGANGLLRILRNQFPRWAEAAQGSSGGLLDWMLGRSRVNLQPHVDQFAQSHPLDYGLQKVLPKVGSPDLTALAHSWLRGQQLGGEDLQRLGLPPVFPTEVEQEASAREVVLSFLRLAGSQTVLVICFDEVEAIQSGTWDAAVLRQFTTLATDLLSETGPRVVATFIRPNLQVELSKSVERSNTQKLAQFTATIPPLSWSQTTRLAVTRLDAEASCKAARAARPDDAYWPLGHGFLDKTFQQNKRVITPRHLITACRVEFDRLHKGKAAEPDEPPGPGGGAEPPTTPSKPAVIVEEFARMWERQRRKVWEKAKEVEFDTVMAIGLPWLVELTETPLVRVHDAHSQLGDVNLLFQPTDRSRKAVGVSFCNHEPRTLWRRLDRLCDKQWPAAKGKLLGSLVVLRADNPPPTARGAEGLADLRKAGVRVILVERQQLAELAAYQAMFTAAQSGDLTREGKPVDVAEYAVWAGGHLSDAVKELFHQVFAADALAAPPAAPAPAAIKPAKKVAKAKT